MGGVGSWTKEQEVLLAEIVLQHLREGSTVRAGCEKAGDQFNRTTVACIFRWDVKVRQHYEEDIRTARNQGKQSRKRKKSVEREQKAQLDQLLSTLISMLEVQQNPGGAILNQDIENNNKEEAFCDQECTINTVILNLQKLKKWEINLKVFSEENEKLRIETQTLRQKNKELESEIELIERDQS